MKNIIMITGASSGIGLEFALQIDTAFSNIDEIWLIARRESRLKEIAKVMQHNVRTIAMDVSDEYAMDDLENLLAESHVMVRMLINAAGFGLIGSFEDISLEEQLDMLLVNCEALTKMTYITLPYMAKGSRIIQMASSAAFLPQPDFAVYAATKSYVLTLSRALNKELEYRGISVTAVCPGPVKTEFFDIAQKYNNISYIKRLSMISVEKCVRAALRASYLKESMVVPGFYMKVFLAATKCIPHDCILSFMNLIK
ncbi:MAG TPA: SDR family NAD(P)-dependent oxidoreductase [Lachnospiraceae bacterium]|nr:SDR family NAD(P)-dependent oxidoreductase [Lachnospiraceae bacterium]